jgi:hypothetical protein
MKTQTGDTYEFTGREIRMPKVYRILFWVIIIDLLVLTGWVWWTVFDAMSRARDGIWFSFEDFRLLLMGYHVLLLLVTIIGWIMQVAWQKLEYMALFPVSMILGTLALHVAAIQMSLIVHGFG